MLFRHARPALAVAAVIAGSIMVAGHPAQAIVNVAKPEPLKCTTLRVEFAGAGEAVFPFVAISCPGGAAILTADMSRVVYRIPAGSNAEGGSFLKFGDRPILGLNQSSLRIGVAVVYFGEGRTDEPGPCGAAIEYENTKPLTYNEGTGQFTLGPGKKNVTKQTIISRCEK